MRRNPKEGCGRGSALSGMMITRTWPGAGKPYPSVAGSALAMATAGDASRGTVKIKVVLERIRSFLVTEAAERAVTDDLETQFRQIVSFGSSPQLSGQRYMISPQNIGTQP